jgi:3-hydroxyacyl-CoA dehydrogenase
MGAVRADKSAAEAKELLFLKPTDGITMNRYRLLADAKAKALSLAADYRPPEPQTLNLPGPSAKYALDMAVDGFFRLGKATTHDVVVSGALAEALSGGDTDITRTLDEDITRTLDEDALLKLERENFIRLVRNKDTLARIEHMLSTGKPLRN